MYIDINESLSNCCSAEIFPGPGSSCTLNVSSGPTHIWTHIRPFRCSAASESHILLCSCWLYVHIRKPTSKCWFEKLQWRLGLALVFLLSSWGWTIHDNQSDFWPEELSEEFKSLRPGIMRTTEQWRNYIDYVIGYTTVNKRHHSWANLRDKTRLWALTALNFLKKQADVVCIFNLREMNEDFTIWDFLYFSFIRNKKESCSSF